MKKISRTEKFLWELYKIYEIFGDILDWPPRSWNDVLYPEYKKLRQVYQKEKDRRTFRNLIYYLKKRGLIEGFKKEEKEGWLLTEKGKEKILKIREGFQKKKKRKDGKWIMVIFDIPERIRIKRDFFRRGLQELDYKILQKSIWVSPYDVLEKTKELVKKYFLKPYVKLLLIEEIELKS